MNAYWAMHYCSILETLNEQKTIGHGFQKSYMAGAPATLRNLAANAGFAFFRDIKQSMKNFGLQSLLCHYLTSPEGATVFFDIMNKLSDYYKYDFSTNPYDYGVFISCKDFASGLRFIQENDPVLLGHEPMLHSQAAAKVEFADLCFLLKTSDRNLAILGEVEGNNGGYLLLTSFWSRKKGEYFSFGIGVKKRSKKSSYFLNSVAIPEPPHITGQWIATEFGYKYVVVIESDHYLIDDFHSAIDTIQVLLTLGPEQRGNYDPSLLPVLNLIRLNWDSDIVGLIAQLRLLLLSNKFAGLGTNPLPVKIIPSIIS